MSEPLRPDQLRVADFFRGLLLRHVDYSTRHFSRTYAWGTNTTTALMLLTPVAVVFGLGFLAGRYI